MFIDLIYGIKSFSVININWKSSIKSQFNLMNAFQRKTIGIADHLRYFWMHPIMILLEIGHIWTITFSICVIMFNIGSLGFII